MTRDEVATIAADVAGALAGACEEIVIAGGLRRGKPDPHDIELVLLPRRGLDLFGAPADGESEELLGAINRLLRQPWIAMDPLVRRDGPRYKRLLAHGVACDLFIATEINFGNTLALRTGDADFSRALVTPRALGGLMPQGMRQSGGALMLDGAVIPCRTEADFFSELGMPVAPEPEVRTLALARRLAAIPAPLSVW